STECSNSLTVRRPVADSLSPTLPAHRMRVPHRPDRCDQLHRSASAPANRVQASRWITARVDSCCSRSPLCSYPELLSAPLRLSFVFPIPVVQPRTRDRRLFSRVRVQQRLDKRIALLVPPQLREVRLALRRQLEQSKRHVDRLTLILAGVVVVSQDAQHRL